MDKYSKFIIPTPEVHHRETTDGTYVESADLSRRLETLHEENKHLKKTVELLNYKLFEDQRTRERKSEVFSRDSILNTHRSDVD